MSGPWPENVQPTDNRPPPPGKRSVVNRVLIAVVIVLVGVAAGLVWTGAGGTNTSGGSNGSAPPQLRAHEVALEPTSDGGANPFMAPVGQDQPNLTAPEQAQGPYSGDTPGLYAEGGDKPSCDTASLLGNLRADPTKLAAWAEALSIQTEDVENFVQSLSPVLLRADSAVTEHGYDNGRFTAYQAVLQAGTAVFVNGFGEPTVKCYSGNPLTRPVDVPQASYVGPGWAQFRPDTITYVTPAPVVIKSYNYYNTTRKVIVVKPSPCWSHPGWKGCGHPAPVWCGDGWPCKGGPPDCKHVECKGKPPVVCAEPCGPSPGGGAGPSPREKFCKDNPAGCDPDGIPIICKGTAGTGNNPLCAAPKGKPDPVLEQKAEEAKKAAEQATAEAKEANEKARQFEINARNADADASALEQVAAGKAQLLAANPNDPALQQAFKNADAAAKKARADAQTARAQADFQAKAAHAVAQTSEKAQEAALRAQREANEAARPAPHKQDQLGPDQGKAGRDKTQVGDLPHDGAQPNQQAGAGDGALDEKHGQGTPAGGTTQAPGPAGTQSGQADGPPAPAPMPAAPQPAEKPPAPGRAGQAGPTTPAHSNPCLVQPKPPKCSPTAADPPASSGHSERGGAGTDNGSDSQGSANENGTGNGGYKHGG